MSRAGKHLERRIYVSFFTWRLPKEGTNELSKDGFYLIALNVIFKGSKGPKQVKFGFILLLFANFLKSGLINFLSLLYTDSWDDIDQLSRGGFN